MSVRRLRGLPSFSIDSVARDAGEDPDVLRLENLDTDLCPPAAAIEATRRAVEDDDANSYLPFLGRRELRRAVAAHVARLSGVEVDPETGCIVTAGGTAGMLNALLATVEEGDEVLLSDPTYAGMIQRVRLAGARPRLVPFRREGGDWRLDLDALRAAVGPRTRALFLMNPSMPSGAVLGREDWQTVAELCLAHDLILLYNAAMERILFDGRPYLHPASFEGMADRTLTIGSVSKEQRMIGWRVGWVAGVPELVAEVARVAIYNVVTPVGIAQPAAAAALEAPETDLRDAVAAWERRRDAVVKALEGWPLIPAGGGWSMLLDVGELGLDAGTASRRLLERGRVAATPMSHWGEVHGDRHVRLVFSNEPVERLAELGGRVEAALG